MFSASSSHCHSIVLRKAILGDPKLRMGRADAKTGRHGLSDTVWVLMASAIGLVVGALLVLVLLARMMYAVSHTCILLPA